ncbi:MAG: sulfurtransferase [Rhodanobacter sp.]|nr:MAG: sulfurtransferase [Rhodanobacter sp.]
MSIVNLAAYRFVSLHDLPMLRERMRERCALLDLKGTILLAPEGINLFLAGSRERVDAFIGWLHEDPRFAAIVPRESLSDTVPFRRLRVRLKQEIITMRQPAIRPEGGRAPALDAATLQRWLAQGHDDAGRELVMLDTRNDYETALGAFAGAVDYRLASFTGFPAAIAADRGRYDGKTVVSYCTGGIRCEKAALHMRDLGMSHVYQLEGGILNYLEQTDGAYWRGDCFVFDERVAVDKRLRARPPLPRGERAGVRGRADDAAEPGRPSIALPASTRPSSHPSPQRGEGAYATRAELDWSGA